MTTILAAETPLEPAQYPYVVIRYMPAVYDVRPVPPSMPRERLVSVILSEVRRTRFRMCCVFAADDCVYCEPDGTTRASNDPPAGGAVLGRGPVERYAREGKRQSV
jgi:hypothetical protein